MNNQKTGRKGVDRVIIAGGGCETFASAVKCLKPGGKIGNVNYLGNGEYVTIPRIAWGALEWDISRSTEASCPAGGFAWKNWAP